jgi:ABC-type glycerol-3-phosphate transport system substrate-binding protein
MKKTFLLVLLVFVVFSLSAGGQKQGTNTETAGKVTLTLYGNAENVAKPYIRKIISLYEEKTGNKIDVQGMDMVNYETIALTKFTTGDIPDLFMHFGNSNLLNFNCDRNFYDFSSAPWVADVVGSVLPQAKVDGKVYGIPFWEASAGGAFYNKPIFARLGIQIPSTQAEFDNACDKLMAAGIQPIYVALGDAWPILYQYALDPVFDSPQGEILLQRLNNNEITYADIPQVRAMLEWYKKAAAKGWLGKTYMTDTWDYTSQALGTGEAAIMFVWDTWFDTDYDNDSYQYKKDDFGLMPVFMGTSDQGTFEGANVCLTMVNKNSPRVKIALEFIDFMATPANYNAAFNGISSNPVFKGQTTVVTSPKYNEVKDLINRVGHASAAQPKIIGFSQVEGAKIIQELMLDNITVDQCIKLLDDDRISTLKSFR